MHLGLAEDTIVHALQHWRRHDTAPRQPRIITRLIIAAPAGEDWSEEQLQAAEDAAGGWAPAEYAYDDAHEGHDHEGYDHEVAHGHHELSEEELAEEEVLRQGQDPFPFAGDESDGIETSIPSKFL